MCSYLYFYSFGLLKPYKSQTQVLFQFKPITLPNDWNCSFSTGFINDTWGHDLCGLLVAKYPRMHLQQVAMMDILSQAQRCNYFLSRATTMTKFAHFFKQKSNHLEFYMWYVYQNNDYLEILLQCFWRFEDLLSNVHHHPRENSLISAIPLVIYCWLSVAFWYIIHLGRYIFVSEMKYNICCCNISLSEGKVYWFMFLLTIPLLLWTWGSLYVRYRSISIKIQKIYKWKWIDFLL